MKQRARTVAFDLAGLQEEIRLATLDLSDVKLEPALVGARLADGLRDAGAQAPTSAEWAAQSKQLNAEGWARLEILVRLMRQGASAPLVAECLRADPARASTAFAIFCAREAKLLTRDLLQKSPFRTEELARKWIWALGGAVGGESQKESAAQRERLDFGGVLKSLEEADKDRERRMEQLRQVEAERLRREQEAYQRAGRE
jgi:hypothetical protein